MKSTWKRFLSLALCICMVFTLLPSVTMTAFAASAGEVTGLSNENIGLSYSGTANNAWSASGTKIEGSAASVAGTCDETSYNSTLTITNKKATTATLSFDYSVELNSGTIQVAESNVTVGGEPIPAKWQLVDLLRSLLNLAVPQLPRLLSQISLWCLM